MAATFNDVFTNGLWVSSTNIVAGNTYALQVTAGKLQTIQIADTIVDPNDIVTNPSLIGIEGFVADSDFLDGFPNVLTVVEDSGFKSWFKNISPTALVIGNIIA